MTSNAAARSASAGASTAVRTPLWVIGLSALLIAGGFGQRSSQEKVHREGNEAHESGRGRSANAPSEIPVSGWKDILLRVYRGISEDRILLVAAGVTFYGLLAIFPGIAALVSIYGLFADATTISKHLDMLAGLLPGGVVDIISEQLQRLTAQPPGKLGLTTFIGLGISLWSANAGIKAMFDALNIVYGEKEKRSFIKLNAVSLAFTAGLIIFSLFAMAAR